MPRPTAAVILVFITGHPIIKKWDDYSTFDIPKIAEYLLKQLKCTIITPSCDRRMPVMKTRITAAVCQSALIQDSSAGGQLSCLPSF